MNPYKLMPRLLGAILTAFLAILMASSITETGQEENRTMRPQDFIIPVPTSSPPAPAPKPNQAVLYYRYVIRGCYLDEVSVSARYIRYEYAGRYYITAYCPYECGYREYDDGSDNFPRGWITASGAICHRASYEDRLTEPTTCAIDMSYGSFGDLYYIEEFDRIFIAEDNGAFRGKWLDLFYEDYSDVLSFPSNHYTVYSVEYVTTEAKKGNHYDINYYLYDCDWSYRNSCRYDFHFND